MKNKTEKIIEQYQIWRSQNNKQHKDKKLIKKEDDSENKKEEATAEIIFVKQHVENFMKLREHQKNKNKYLILYPILFKKLLKFISIIYFTKKYNQK